MLPAERAHLRSPHEAVPAGAPRPASAQPVSVPTSPTSPTTRALAAALQTLAAVLDGSTLAEHSAVLQRAARTGSTREGKEGEEGGSGEQGSAGSAAPPAPLPQSQQGGGVDIGEARMTRRATVPVRCAALRALARAWACAEQPARAGLGAALLETGLVCAVSDWDVRMRALELVGALYAAAAGSGGGGGDGALPAELAQPDALRRALGACCSGLEDGKFVAVRKASAAALLALAHAGAPLPAELLAGARAAVADAREREKDSQAAGLLAQVGARIDELLCAPSAPHQ